MAVNNELERMGGGHKTYYPRIFSGGTE